MPGKQPKETPAVVFLHGVGGSARAWAPQIGELRGRRLHAASRSICPAMAGGRRSRPWTSRGWPPTSRRRSRSAACERPVLVGHSLGGMIAQTMLRRRPDGYSAAVLACTSPAFGNADGEFQRKFVADRIAPARRRQDHGRPGGGHRRRASIGPGADPAGRALAVAVHERGAARRPIVRRCAASSPSTSAPTSATSAYRCSASPASTTATRRPPMMERMAGKIPGARYVCLPGIGHLPNLEAPATFDAAILDFLRQALAPAPEQCCR